MFLPFINLISVYSQSPKEDFPPEICLFFCFVFQSKRFRNEEITFAIKLYKNKIKRNKKLNFLKKHDELITDYTSRINIFKILLLPIEFHKPGFSLSCFA